MLQGRSLLSPLRSTARVVTTVAGQLVRPISFMRRLVVVTDGILSSPRQNQEGRLYDRGSRKACAEDQGCEEEEGVRGTLFPLHRGLRALVDPVSSSQLPYRPKILGTVDHVVDSMRSVIDADVPETNKAVISVGVPRAAPPVLDKNGLPPFRRIEGTGSSNVSKPGATPEASTSSFLPSSSSSETTRKCIDCHRDFKVSEYLSLADKSRSPEQDQDVGSPLV